MEQGTDNDYIYDISIERPIGTSHPEHPSIVYSVNYGYVDGVEANNGGRQGAYIVGVDTPIDRFAGKKIAIIHRIGDDEQWVIAPENMPFNKQQIEEMVYFAEQLFDSKIEMLNEEMWDAYDREGNPLGYQIPRSMAKSLNEGVYHIVVNVYVLRSDGCVLTTQRSRNKTYPLKWEITGGSILSGETPIEGARRELFEETGIQADIKDFIELYCYVDDVRHCIYHTYLVHISTGTQIHLQIGETMDYTFLNLNDFIQLVESDRFVPSEKGRFKLFKNSIIAALDT